MARGTTEVFEDFEAPNSPDQREAAQSVLDHIRSSASYPLLVFPDGAEYRLSAIEYRMLLTIATARAAGRRISLVSHDGLLTPRQAADVLGVSRPMVYRFIERGDLDATRVGTHWRLKAPDVLALAARRARLADRVDTGLERVTDAMAAHEDAPQTVEPDAKESWRSADEEQRAAALARVRRRAKDRRR